MAKAYEWYANLKNLDEVSLISNDYGEKLKSYGNTSLDASQLGGEITEVSYLISQLNDCIDEFVGGAGDKLVELSKFAEDVSQKTNEIEKNIVDGVDKAYKIKNHKFDKSKKNNVKWFDIGDNETFNDVVGDLNDKYSFTKLKKVKESVGNNSLKGVSAVAATSISAGVSSGLSAGKSNGDSNKIGKIIGKSEGLSGKKDEKNQGNKNSSGDSRKTGSISNGNKSGSTSAISASVVAAFESGELSKDSTIQDLVDYINGLSEDKNVKIDVPIDVSTDTNNTQDTPTAINDVPLTDEERASHYFTNTGNVEVKVDNPAPQQNNITNTRRINVSNNVAPQNNSAPVEATPPPATEVVEPSTPITTDIQNNTTDLFDVEDDYTDSYTPETSTTKKGHSSVVPILGGLGAAAAVGVGAKVYSDKKANNGFDLDDERPSNDNKFWTDDDSKVINSEKDEFGDDEEYTNEVQEDAVESYTASQNNFDDDTWDMPDDEVLDNETVDLLGR